MSFRDWFLFISTFLVAVLCGMYLYFTTFVPTYIANETVQELSQQVAPSWTVSATLYGGCAMSNACPAFEINSRGAYRYQPTPGAAIETGSLPRALRSRYRAALENQPLAQLAAPVQAQSCRSFVDGTDYTIRVTAGAEQYQLDTCQSNLSYDNEFVALVNETLTYLDNPDTYRPAPGESTDRGGLDGYLERKLDETFDYDD